MPSRGFRDWSAAALQHEVRFSRLNAHWEPLHTLVRQFLEQATPFLAAGGDALGMAWLFDMNELFEAYVAARLRRLVWPTAVRVQGPSRPLAQEGAFDQRPDLVIGSPGAPRLIADTKWKQLGDAWTGDVAAADIRQVYAYGRLYGSPRVALLYPAWGSDPRTAMFHAADDGPDLAITVAELPMRRGDMKRLDDALVALVRDPVAA